MVRSSTRRVPDRRSARGPAAGRSYVDPRWLGDVRRAVTLLSSLLAAPTDYALFATDLDGTIMLWSQGATGLFGYTVPAVLGKLSWWDMCAEGRSAGEPDRAPLEAALRDGSWSGSVTRSRGTGERITLSLVVSVLPDETGRPVGLLTMSRDISAEISRVEELERARFAAMALFEANVVPLATTDPLGSITDVNRPAELLTGRSREELVGTRVTDYAVESQRAQAALRTLLRDGRLTDQEFTVRRPDDSTVEVLLSASAVTDQAGKLHGLLATILDLSEQRRLRERLQRSEAYYRGLIEAAADGLITVDADGMITDLSRQVCVLTGYGRDELVGSAFADCFRDRDQARQLMERGLAGEAGETELHLVTSDESVRWVAVSASIFRDLGDKAPRLVASMRDVTEQAALRDRLARERAYNRSLIEASANGLIVTDLRLLITDVNGTICQLMGLTREQLTGSRLPDCFADPDAATDAAHRALLAGEVTNCDLRLATPDQTAVLVNVSIFRDDAGQPAGLLASVRDVSVQAGLQRDLAVQQAYTRAIVESSVVALFTVAQDGRITDVNEAACEFTGYSRRRLQARRFTSLFSDTAAAKAGLELAFGDGHVDFLELSLAPAGRPSVAVGFHAGMFLDPRTGQKALIVAVRDITAEKATQEELHIYSQSLYGATTDALLLTDPTGVITDVNRSMEELTGRSRGDLVGRPAETCFTERDRAHEFVASVLREGRVSDVELTVRRPDGGSTVLWYSAATFRDQEGKLQGIFASARDITERKKFEDLQAHMLERAQDLDRAKSDFVSRISHELRSPLTSVLGYLELIAEGEPGPLTTEQRRMLDVISRNGSRLLALIEDLLLMSRIEAGTVTVQYELIRLGGLVQSVHNSFLPSIRAGQLNVRLDLDPSLELDGDPAQLERLVANLISNAIKFTPPGGEIGIGCRREGDDAVVEVRDTGIGVPEEEQPRLFTRFFRSSISMEQETQGTGLGLFIVKHVAQAHSGLVTVVSAPGAGSAFTVRLPVRRSSQPYLTGREVVA